MARALLCAAALAGGSTAALPATVASATASVALGDYVQLATNTTNFSPIDQFIAQLGHTPALLQAFYGWDNSTFPKAFVDYAAGKGAVPMVTWDPGSVGIANNSSTMTSPLAQVNTGYYDKYFTAWAQAAKADGHVILLRTMQEMNASWFSWGHGVYNNTPAEYVSAFQHIVNVFRHVGATNVKFVWCVSSQGNKGIPSFYPGDGYVDWVAMDGYNHSTQPASDVTDIFTNAYNRITSITNKPLMIAEIATVEDRYNPNAKAQWLLNNFETLLPKDFPKVSAVVYFDANGAQYSYPVTSSPQSFAAYKQVATSPLYQGTVS